MAAPGRRGALPRLILFTYSKSDPGWSHQATGSQVANAGGKAGAWIADVAALCVRPVRLVVGALPARRRGLGLSAHRGAATVDRRSRRRGVRRFLLLITASSAFESLRLYSLKVQLPHVARRHARRSW